MEILNIAKDQIGKRIDKFLAQEFFLYSRGEIIKKIKSGQILVNDKVVKPSYVLEEGDVLTTESLSHEKQEEKLQENDQIPLEILFENEDFIVLNKQAGIQVHPSANEKNNTLCNALVAKYPEIKNVHDDSEGAYLRPGIVHRLDKDTSGVMVAARNLKSFDALKEKFKSRDIEKKYIAVCEGLFKDKMGKIEKAIARSGNYRKQVIARQNTKTIVRAAVTEYSVKKEIGSYSLVDVFPKTGRMHQIRIHLASIGHPIVGDTVYGKKIQENSIRQLLHAEQIKFELFGKQYDFIVPLPKDFEDFLSK